jgi:hypothetical protein
MKFVIAIAALFLGISSVAAQTSEPDSYEINQANIELIRSALHVERKAIIANNMTLSETEQQAFWPTYHEYRVATNRVKDRLLKLIFEYADLHNTDSITDRKALKLLDDFLSLQHEMVRLKRSYVKLFKKVLPAKKAARFYQIDHRLDTIDLLRMSQNTPLFE